MEQIGYSLVDGQGNELQHWGDAPGSIANPGRVVWPNGDITEGISGPVDHGEWKLVERRYQWGASASGPSFDGTAVLVTGGLSTLKADLKRKVDVAAEQIRMTHLTPGFGMSLTYKEKHEQALAVMSLGQSPANSLTDAEARAAYPTLAASVGIEAPTLWECVQIVIQRYEAFANLSYDIERTRLAAKALIGLASDAAAARAAYEAIQWPS